MLRKILLVFLVATLAGVGVAAWWLTRRPLTYVPLEANASAARAEGAYPEEEEPFREDEGGDENEPMLQGVDVPDDFDDEDQDPPMRVQSSQRTERLTHASLADAESYLLVGVDHTRGAWGRADTLVVAIFDDETGHVGLVSIPRDLYVEVPGHGVARINATLRIAVRAGDDPLATIGEVVGEVLDLPIEHVVVADIESFEETVDALGGLDVDVPCAIRDSFLDARAESGRRPLDVEAGEQHMDGLTAAMYVRSRHGRSDWDRARRQQAVLASLRRKVRSMGVGEWLPVLQGALEGGVLSTMNRLQMLAMGRRVGRLDEAKLHGLLIGSRQTSHHLTDDGKRVLMPDYDAIDESLGRLFEAPAPGVRPGRRRCQDTDAALQRNYGS